MNIDEEFELLPAKLQRSNLQAIQRAIDILTTRKGGSDTFYAALVHDSYLASKVSVLAAECVREVKA